MSGKAPLVTVTPDPPCQHCSGLCCVQKSFGHKFAVGLEEREYDQFPESVWHPSRYLGEGNIRVLPYVNGRCIHLSDDNRCKIYDRRPENCRQFNCVSRYYSRGMHHGFFLEDNPDLVQIIELHLPDFAESRKPKDGKPGW